MSIHSSQMKRTVALQRVQNSNRLLEVYTLEKEQLEMVIDLASMVEDPANHWKEYERLKEIASRFVGFYARHDELATCQHYEVMLDFIDWLLPDGRIEDWEDMEDAS